MNLQTSGASCRENAHVRHRPRRRTIQYSATLEIDQSRLVLLDTRRSLSSGAHSRDPVAGMTAVGGATSIFPTPNKKGRSIGSAL
ncbi:hypothetical protein [Bradyrhizobium sp. S69]|uniref:hypothetical protein n=1 Tax=Bradyrhizobium sp. S69 TaxID=1641856 RepID=UPI001AEEA6A2|nr:hypothetical protein [Bradyrhizobium sp. S69]